MKEIRVKHLAIYIVSAFVFNRILYWFQDVWIGSQTTESGILFAYNVTDTVGYWVDVTLLVALLWFIVRAVAEIRWARKKV